MNSIRPGIIQARHLARKAVVYVRQSSEDQVLRNQGSTEAQRNQQQLAREWGWRKDQIEVIDADLGLSGSATEHRQGYQRMVAEIRAHRVGIVFLTDYSRAGRRSVEWFLLLETFEQHDVLLAIDGVAYDSTDASTVLMSRIQAVFGEHENRVRRGHMDRGRMAKIKAGKTVSYPPIGYVRLPDGSWIRDPDLPVQYAVDAVFRAFLKGRSLRAAARILQDEGLRIPRRRVGYPVRWGAPDVPTVQRIVTNPNYTGDYVWGRSRSDSRNGRNRHGHARPRRVDAERHVVVSDHHEPYVTRADWSEIRSILTANRWGGVSPGGLGRGAALLQGLIRCRLHRGLRMLPNYARVRGSRSRLHAYRCAGNHPAGGRLCGARPGRLIDDVIVKALLLRLEPPALEHLRELWREARRDALALGQLQDDELRRAEREVENLWERYTSVQADRPLVRAELEQRLEEAKRSVLRLRDRGKSPSSSTAIFKEDMFPELIRLSTQLPAIWSCPTTSNLDRKEIVRGMIHCVYVDAYDSERIDLTIEWSDGTAATRHQVVLQAATYRMIRAWHAEGSDAETIANRLTREGFRTRFDTEWGVRAVKAAIKRWQSQPPNS